MGSPPARSQINGAPPASRPATKGAVEPSRSARLAILLLTAYAVVVIGPDLLRATPFLTARSQSLQRWYPLGTLGFEADNDGLVTAVEATGPAAKAGVRRGDRIDLTAPSTDRRAVNQLVFVNVREPHTFRLVRDRQPPRDLTLTAKPESMSALNALMLALAEVAGLFFIGFCAFLVWRHSTRETWGFFLYSIWFNSGQYFVWYANLSDSQLRYFDYAQAVFQALGLTGLLLFALHFPRDRVEGWRRFAEALLVIPASHLLIFGLWAFRNFTDGEPTELAYRIYYASTLIVYAVVGAIFLDTFRSQPDARPKVQWIMLAAVWGLGWFLVADIYEATSLFPESLAIPDWLVHLFYAQNVCLPLTVVWAVLRHRVIPVRLAITRSVVFTAVAGSVAVALELAKAMFEHRLHENEVLKAAGSASYAVSVLLGLSVARMDSRLHGVCEAMLFRQWRRAEARLHERIERLNEVVTINVDDVHSGVTEEPVDALGLTGAALYHRTGNGDFEREHDAGTAAKRWPSRLTLADIGLSEASRVPQRLDAPDADDPALVISIIVQQRINRLVLFGLHRTGEDLDRDEIRLLHELARAAGTAYIHLGASV